MTAPRDDDSDPAPCWMMDRANLFGRLGMIVCWYWDEPDSSSIPEAVRAVRLIPKLLAGRTESFTSGDWWLFCDAVGSYPHRDKVLDEIYELADRGHRGELPPGRTPAFAIEDSEEE